METRVPGDASVIGWLRDRAIPLRHLDAGTGFADLRPLAKTLQDARVIGLGEATHGTSEFFRLKHRLLELAVAELGVTVFAIEASHAACQPLNAWVLRGEGDRDAGRAGVPGVGDGGVRGAARLAARLERRGAAAPQGFAPRRRQHLQRERPGGGAGLAAAGRAGAGGTDRGGVPGAGRGGGQLADAAR